MADVLAALTSALTGGGGGALHLSAQIDGLVGSLRVTDVSIDETLGALPGCSFSVQGGMVQDVRDLFGKTAVLTLDRGGLGGARVLRGIVRSGSSRMTEGGVGLHLDVVPGLWLLQQSVDSRVYQDITVPDLVTEVVTELLGDRDYEVRHELSQRYPKHESLVQHRESHLGFLTRLLADEGIWFTFDHEDDHEILVLCDTNADRPPIQNGAMGYVDVTMAPFEPHHEAARPVRVVRSLGPTDAVVSGFDWTNPTLEVQGEEPGGAQVPIEVHEHDAPRYGSYDDGLGQYTENDAERRARLRRERFAMGRTSWMIETNVVTARVGETIELAGGERYLIIASRLSATRRFASNTLRVLPVELPFRPATQARSLMSGPETATVVGPGGEDVHVDAHGRVKVQFHWDRRGQRDDRSSAWIRVSQAWVGQGGGSVFMPRVGTEVIVNYLGGNPDRPVIVGSLYNGVNRPPVDLPANKTQSGFRSSAPAAGGGPSNELMFDDQPGAESVSLGAKRDMVQAVGRNLDTVIQGAQAVKVARDLLLEVKGETRRELTGAHTETRGGGSTVTIEGGETRAVRGGQTVSVAGGQTVRVDGDRRETVTGGAALEVDGGATRRVRGAAEDRIDGAVTLEAASLEQRLRGPLRVQASEATLTTTSAFALEGASLALSSHGDLSAFAASLELAGEALSSTFTRQTVIGAALSTIVGTQTTTAQQRIVDAVVSTERIESESRAVKTRLETVGQDIRSAAVSVLSNQLTLIG